MKKLSPIILFCLILLGLSAARGQIGQRSTPFAPGETLRYEGRLNKSILPGVSVADLILSVDDSADGKNYVMVTEANSKGSLIKLFKINFRQRYESTVDKSFFRILRTVKHDQQRERVRDSVADFDYQTKQVTFVETDPKDAMRPPRKIASTIREDTVDMLSGIYAIRQLPLAVGKTFELSVSDTGFVYRIPVRVTARERMSSIFGKTWCFRVEPEIFGKNRLIEDEGKIVIWITDDRNRVPVRSEISTALGKVEIKLKKYKK